MERESLEKAAAIIARIQKLERDLAAIKETKSVFFDNKLEVNIPINRLDFLLDDDLTPFNKSIGIYVLNFIGNIDIAFSDEIRRLNIEFKNF